MFNGQDALHAWVQIDWLRNDKTAWLASSYLLQLLQEQQQSIVKFIDF